MALGSRRWAVTDSRCDGWHGTCLLLGGGDSALLSLKSDLFLLAETMDPLRNEQLFHADYGWAFKDLGQCSLSGQKTIADPEQLHLERGFATYRSGAHLVLRPIMMRAAARTGFERLGRGAEAM